MKNKFAYIIPLISLLLAGCGTTKNGGSSDTPSGDDTSGQTIEPSIMLDRESLSLYVGNSYTFTATTSNGEGLITWTSSNEEVASISDGIVNALKVGNTTITATYSGKTASCYVVVNEAPATITLNTNSLTVGVGEDETLVATITNGSGSVTWSSNNTSVATVNNGVVTGVSKGNAIITASYSGVSTTCSVLVTDDGEEPVRPTTGTTTIDVWATNDIHGAIDEEVVDGDQRLGIGKLATYLKEQGDKDNSLLLDQGDTWQGTIYSNNNRGALITDIMNYIHYDARTIGNHDFDWGMDYIKQNKVKQYNGYSTPVLGGNIYDYNFETRTKGTTQQSDLGEKSVVYTLENKLKVGILGCIGEDQLTSITTSNVEDIYFGNEIDFIKSEATYLRNVQNCDIVIASVHAGVDGSDLTNYQLDSYVDLLLAGHTHRLENQTVNGVHFAQFGENSENLGHIKLTFDYSTNKVTSTNVTTISANSIRNSISVESNIQDIITSYKNSCTENANEVIANAVNGTFQKNGTLPNLMTKAILDRCTTEGKSVALAMVNKARADMVPDAGVWTYGDLLTSFPFDNEIFIIQAKGSELKNEMSYSGNFICRSSSYIGVTFDDNTIYTIAVIDYLAVHSGSVKYGRSYDYFPYGSEHIVGKLSKTYRYVLEDWLIDNGYNSGKSLNYYDYTSSKDEFKKT